MRHRELTIPAPSLADAPASLQPASGSPGAIAKEIVHWLVGSAIEEIERELILQTLAHCCGNRTRAAGVLGISIRTLRNKIREYEARGLAVPEPSRRKSTEPATLR